MMKRSHLARAMVFAGLALLAAAAIDWISYTTFVFVAIGPG